LREEAIRWRHGGIHPAKALQGHLAQTASHGIAHDQRADERRAADGSAEQHAKMRAPVKRSPRRMRVRRFTISID
jgi:hypothetical protein